MNEKVKNLCDLNGHNDFLVLIIELLRFLKGTYCLRNMESLKSIGQS